MSRDIDFGDFPTCIHFTVSHVSHFLNTFINKREDPDLYPAQTILKGFNTKSKFEEIYLVYVWGLNLGFNQSNR